MKKIVSVVSVLLVVLLFAGCDLFTKQQVEYIKIVDENGDPADTIALGACIALNIELKNAFGVEFNALDASTATLKVPAENQEKTTVELEASIALLKAAVTLGYSKEVEYIESTKTLLITLTL